ncbi:MAG: hypothetical protein R3F49_19615 [Planctomycetota bacterium]
MQESPQNSTDHPRSRGRGPLRPRGHRGLALALGACAALSACRNVERAPYATLHPTYRPTLAAVQDALDHEELEVAARTLQRWRARLTADRAFAANAETVDTSRPGPEALDAAFGMVERLESIVEGRRVLAALDLGISLRRVPDAQRVEVHLSVQSRWPSDLEWQPGPGILEVERLSLEPTSGRESRGLETVPLPRELRLTLPAGGTLDVVLNELPIGVPPGAIATRIRCAVVLRGGTLLVDGRELPSRPTDVRSAERTDLPSWLPAAPVEPEELARLAAYPEATQAALVERAVRILPEQRLDALELLREPGGARRNEDFPPLVPVLRWLSGTVRPNRDVEFWRAYLAEARWRRDTTR